jgi:hypothetical protein
MPDHAQHVQLAIADLACEHDVEPPQLRSPRRGKPRAALIRPTAVHRHRHHHQ